ncbi:MAG: DUF2057 family protein [Hahellaceae bacterium]|nr:DUF2057 family protein [Hahellaceae bacterium]MCP5210617.1 DUF2057 family protein [Hahellaceae bacterium]
MSWKLSEVIIRSAIGVLMLVIVGCSGNYPIQTYDGSKLPDDQVSILKAPEDIDVVSIDGKEMTSYLLENLAIDYYFLPGPHVIVFKYSGVWSAPGVKKDDERPPVDLVESKLLQITLNAEAGKVYTFDYPVPQTRTQAFDVAKVFEARIKDKDGLVAKSESYDPKKSAAVVATTAAAAASVTNVAATEAPVAEATKPVAGVATVAVASKQTVSDAAGGAPATGDLPRLEALKVLWGSASKEEKKEFMRWAFK